MRHLAKSDFESRPDQADQADQAMAARAGPAPARDFQTYLARFGGIAARDLQRALEQADQSGVPLDEVLRANGYLSEVDIARARAGFSGLGFVSLLAMPPDPRLTGLLDPAECLALSVLPWRVMGGLTWVAVPDRDTFDANREMLRARFGPVAPVACDRSNLQRAVAMQGGVVLRDRAEARVDPEWSARIWPRIIDDKRLWFVLALVALVAVLMPSVLVIGLLVWMILTLAASTFLRAVALMNTALPRPVVPQNGQALPEISILVPMYNEPDIAQRLLRRLERLDYPRELLDLVLVLEQDDTATQDALAAAHLPPWIRVIIAPPGVLRTKPRAMNYALDFCHGSIIGIYDAEDAPESGQLREVAAHFASASPDLACLQGALDYYNPHTNWLARCFTVEYAAWFRVMMPTLQRLGLPMPLGGTTLFIRRDILEQIGAWDAHNVTEDADLGVRLARYGYRTEMLASTTEEEANCRLRPWLRQRSRWIKGHLLTWAVHMRDPVRLWRDLGPRAFIGYQVVFLGAQSQVLLAPFMWSFWLAFAGLPHPVSGLVPPLAMMVLFGLFLLAEALAICVGVLGARRTRHSRLARWAPSLHFYHPLAALAGWRAVWESFTRPFYWAKTSHGHFDTVRISLPPPMLTVHNRGAGASARSKVPGRVLLFRRAELVVAPKDAVVGSGPTVCEQGGAGQASGATPRSAMRPRRVAPVAPGSQSRHLG